MTEIFRDDIRVHIATAADAPIIARQRAEMFRDMGRVDGRTYAELAAAAQMWLSRALASGEYIGWLASPVDSAGEVIGGAGVVVRRIPPFPYARANGELAVAEGRQALVQNVYTEKTWRRRGIAALLMSHVIAWSERDGIESLVLHASVEGRPLYDQLGFQQTNEMVYRNPRSAHR